MNTSEFDNKINPHKNIVEEFFRIYNHYSNKYGKDNTICLMQVGSFHECYQTETQGFKLNLIGDLLNMIVSKKNKSIQTVDLKNPYMLGFPSSVLSKYLKILIDNNYSVIIIDQITSPPNPKREVTGIYSPGTFIPDASNNINQSSDANFVLGLYLEESSDLYSGKFLLSSGLSLIDVTTGKVIIHEIYANKQDDKYSLDEISKFILSYQVKEIVIYYNNLITIKMDDIILYLELNKYNFNVYNLKDNKKPYEKLSYQKTILTKVYNNIPLLGNNNIFETLDIEKYNFSRLSLILLLDYIYDHNQNIINKLDKPLIYYQNKILNLGNNAIFQLNLLTYDSSNITGMYNKNNSYKSVFDVLNKTSTPMGKRLLKNTLVQPLTNENILNERYNIIDRFINNQDILKKINIDLLEIGDIERLRRKLDLSLLNPLELYNLINGIDKSINIINFLSINKFNLDVNITKILDNNIKFIDYIFKQFNINNLQKYLLNDISGPIFIKGLYRDLDKITNNIELCENMMNIISNGLSEYLDKLIDNNNKNDNNLIRIESNDRDGHFLILTKRRADILERQLQKDKQIKIKYNNKDNTEDVLIIKHDQIDFKHLPKGNNSKIFFPMLASNSTKLNDYIEQLKILNKQYYLEKLEYISNNFSFDIQKLIDLISLIDFLKSGALIAINNHYTKPIIKNHSSNFDKSYIKTKQIRHPLIELINTNTEYIPTDIHIGIDKQDGILLYGLNSAGKSSLQKSIGINLIMAQMGYFVAANSFIYKPYHSLFTRITSNDNLFKGLSSFALELVELRAILKRSGMNTLVIADEVCKGTEHQSSIIIVSSMIKILSENQTSFITATHLHELIEVETIKKCVENNVKIYHLHVSYNDKTNELIYDRKLRSGNGEHFYGLNVAKHFINMDNFLTISNDIKNEYFSNHSLVRTKQSNYNSELYMDYCSICGYKPKKHEIPLETHHIIFQKDFKNDNIRIGIAEQKQHIKMNQLSNLVVLCYKCHDKIDDNSLIIQGWQDTSKGSKLIYE